MSSEFHRESAEEGKPQQNLNNFRFRLPGGPSRKLYDELKVDEGYCDARTEELFQAMDSLLAREFPELDVQAISIKLDELHRMYTDSRNASLSGGQPITYEEIARINAAFHEEQDKLRPLFARLLEMGFAHRELTR